MMNSMLSMERAQGFQPSLFVTKRLCLSSLFSVGFLALLGGVLLGRYSFQRAFKLQSLVNVDKGDENFPELTHDAVPFVIEEIRASDLQQYITSLNVEPSDDLSSDLKQARILWQHFKDQGLDIVSHIHESSILLTFASRDSPSRISIVDESGATKFNLSGLLSSAPPKVDGKLVNHNVQASVAYVNFGRDTDFDYLESQQHILIANNIILARLGKVPPIILVDRALSRGALGVLLFADPEASLVTAERQLVTPAQLGLMQALHGDPSTPDKQAVVHGENNAKLECVPVEVISPESAEQIVRHMLANDDTPGSLFGKSNSIFNRATGFSNINHEIRLEVNFINVVRVFHSVMAGIRGSREPDRHILLVTSRESLLNNELGPTGGTAAMMELAKVFGVLLNTKGWRPHRSIVFCNLGLAFMEGHYISPPFMDSWGDLLESNVVSYLSVDNPVADNRSLEVEVSPLLSKVVQDSSALVPNPRLLEVMGNSQKIGQSGLTLDTTIKPVSKDNYVLKNMHNLGVPSLELHYADISAQLNKMAASNSNLDIDSDPGLRSHKAMTQLWGILTWKMADSLLLPFSPTSYADFLNNTLTAIETKYKRVINENKLVLSELNSAIKNLSIAVSLFQKKMDTVDKSDSLQLRVMNDQLLQLDKAFIHNLHEQHLYESHVESEINSALEPLMTTPGDAIGFGILQDLLSELNTSPGSPTFVEDIQTYISMLVHCVKSATRVFQGPLQSNFD